MEKEKQLLLKDLCARVPYVTFVYVEREEGDLVPLYDEDGNLVDDDEPNVHTLISCNYYGECDIDDYSSATIYDIKPYLRPMSSMTEEEKEEYDKTFDWNYSIQGTPFDWLNAHHFDYRGLIEKGLALEAPTDMYKTE